MPLLELVEELIKLNLLVDPASDEHGRWAWGKDILSALYSIRKDGANTSTLQWQDHLPAG